MSLLHVPSRGFPATALLLALALSLAGCAATAMSFEHGRAKIDVLGVWVEGDNVCFLIEVTGLNEGEAIRITAMSGRSSAISSLGHVVVENGKHQFCIPLATMDGLAADPTYEVALFASDPEMPAPFPPGPRGDDPRTQEYNRHIADHNWTKAKVVSEKKKGEFPAKPEIPDGTNDHGRL